MNKKKLGILSLVIGISSIAVAQQKYSICSPDKKIELKISVSDSIYYQVIVDHKELIGSSAIGLEADPGKPVWKVIGAKTSAYNETLYPVVWQKSKEIENNYTQIHLDFSNGLSLDWKAFNNGIAWRWVSRKKGPYKIKAEQAAFNFASAGKSWYPLEERFFSHNEREYKNYSLAELDDQKLASLPALFESGGTKVLLTESDLFDYAGMWLRGRGKNGVRAVFPAYPKIKEITSDRDEEVKQREDYLAKINGARSFPWRIVMIAREDKEILNNQMPYLLARPAEGDFSWVKPGKVQWDWWHYNNVYEVNFKAGINNETYKYYIDFASKYGIEYVLLDEGWCDTRDLTKQSAGIDIGELARYAKTKNVGLLLWTSWLVLDKQLDLALDEFQKWGIKGIKVDFMQRDDQPMVSYYEKVAKAAASRKMLVDFHGAYKPTGWLRSYPNVLTSEGVFGNEISKFDPKITPDHTATLPFTRMAAGPMDFTPGGMLNVHKKEWAEVPSEPMTLGTRCNQLAMYVIFESPLQMLCDIPTHYYKEPEAMDFLKSVPTVWARSIALDGKIGEYVAMARQAKNGDWYVAAMTDWTARDLNIDFSFLPPGEYRMRVWKDGINADRNAKDFKMEDIKVNSSVQMSVKLASGGGWVARITKL